jgi:hypothetical protein
MVAIEAAKVVALMVLDFGRVASVAFGDPKPGLARSRWLGPGDPGAKRAGVRTNKSGKLEAKEAKQSPLRVAG